MAKAVHSLSEIAVRCEQGEPLESGLAQWLGGALRRFLTREALTLEEAFGLKVSRGGAPWWLVESMRVRDTALRDLAARFFPDQSTSARANLVYELSLRYAETAWHHDAGEAPMPSGYVGSPQEYLWRAFKSGAPIPLEKRQLRTILSH